MIQRRNAILSWSSLIFAAVLATLPSSSVAALIDNLVEPVRVITPITTGAVDLWATQSFRTDANPYELVSIITRMGDLTGGAVTAELRIGDDPTGPLVTTLTVGPLPGVGVGEVTLTQDTPTLLEGMTRYFLVIYGPEGTAFGWEHALGNNHVGPGFFDTYWYTFDRGVTWADTGWDDPYFLRVNVEAPCPEDLQTDSSCVFVTGTGCDPRIDVRRGACDTAQSGAPVYVITGDLRWLSEQSDWGTASSGALRLSGDGACT